MRRNGLVARRSDVRTVGKTRVTAFDYTLGLWPAQATIWRSQRRARDPVLASSAGGLFGRFV